MKVKTAELEGIALDYAVAIAINGKVFVYPDGGFYPPAGSVSLGAPGCLNLNDGDGDIKPWRPSTDWSQCGPLIERAGVSLAYSRISTITPPTPERDQWEAATLDSPSFESDKPLVAACRAIAWTKLGEEVEIPDELCEVRE